MNLASNRFTYRLDKAAAVRVPSLASQSSAVSHIRTQGITFLVRFWEYSVIVAHMPCKVNKKPRFVDNLDLKVQRTAYGRVGWAMDQLRQICL